MNHNVDKYATYADHPRYGRRPNVTGLNPSPHDRDVHLHWNAISHSEIATQMKDAFAEFNALSGKQSPDDDFAAYLQLVTAGFVTSWQTPTTDFNASDNQTQRIPNTAIAADPARQTRATVPVTHYFDLERRCRDCNRPFIFFAAEQKYWYEQLGFGLDSDCVRCVECRKIQQEIARQRQLYESLFHVANKNERQKLEMAAACLHLIEHGIFTVRQTQRVRILLNSIPQDADVCSRSRHAELFERLLAAEAKCGL